LKLLHLFLLCESLLISTFHGRLTLLLELLASRSNLLRQTCLKIRGLKINASSWLIDAGVSPSSSFGVKSTLVLLLLHQASLFTGHLR
jgi:hypothetical protein